MKSSPKETMTGTLSLHFEGYGFVVALKPGLADVFVPARHVGDAMDKDVVEVSLQKGRKGLFEGKILRVIERGIRQVAGRLEPRGKQWHVVSEDRRVHSELLLEGIPREGKKGDTVVAAITRYPSKGKPPMGKVIRVLPKRGTLQSEVEYIIAKHQWPRGFPDAVEREAAQIRKQTADRQKTGGQAGEERTDLRDIGFVTIDGDDAKDFDDAVFAETLPYGKIRVRVAIADVSHYVRPGSLLDREALERGTSVYFPGRVLPMLPEVLSNDLCSLRPDEDRLVLVADFVIGSNGEVEEEQFYNGVIRSQARLTYTLVKRTLLDQELALRQQYHHLLTLLQTLSEAAKRHHQMKRKRGSLDFDLPEPEIVLDFTGGIEDIERSERHWGHQIIEELMIAANEAVARRLTAARTGCLYRIHESPDPDRVRNLYAVVQRLGYRGPFPTPPKPLHLASILTFFKGHAEERFVNTTLLRSLAQAMYAPENLGHFGLGSDCYCHFTSPIRRYPDLAIHRLLKRLIAGDRRGLPPRVLSDIGEKSSIQERRAMEAEREVLKLHRALFMRDRVGEAFEGLVAHVTKLGFFVELFEYFVEGLVPKESLPGHFVFDPDRLALTDRKKRREFRVGDKVRIEVAEVKLAERLVFFNLLDFTEKGSVG